MDLLTRKQSDTIDVIIKDPVTGKDPVTWIDTDIVITVYGTHTTQWSEAVSNRKQPDKRGAHLLALVTKDWTGVTENDVELSPTTDNIERVYQVYGWLRDQVDVALADKARFFPQPANPLQSTVDSSAG